MLDPDGATVAEELARAKFEDVRLSKRLGQIARRLAESPSWSFPKCLSSSELEGAYRFFGNAKVTPGLILSGHFEALRARAAKEVVALVIHDTTTFAFDEDGQRVGLGRLRSKGQAFFAHTSLVLADDGSRRPLGIAALDTWVRDGEPKKGTEKDRWFESVQRASSCLEGTCALVHIMDREGDNYALFDAMLERGDRFVIRLAQDRVLETTSDDDSRKLLHATARIECVVQREAKLSSRAVGNRSPKQKKIHPSRKARVAALAIGGRTITILKPPKQAKTLAPSLTLNLVRVWETNPPEGEAPVEWILLTTEPIETPHDLEHVVDRYRARWTIEEYFKALKTGCSFEDRQLGDYEGLVNALAVFMPIAVRMLLLRSEAHRVPDARATLVVDDDELDVLRAAGRRTLPQDPTYRDVLLAIAALGGHIKYAPDPGWQTISRGFEKLEILTAGWRLAKLQPHSDQR